MPLLFQRRLRAEDRPVTAQAIRELLNIALAKPGLTGAAGQPLRFAPHDFRRMLITDAIMHGMPPHIAQLVAGHRDINTTMGYKAVYPEEVINGHRAFIARRRALRPSAEYRTPTDAEWEEFLGHFERRKLALGDCGRAYGTSCIHEHSCIRCPLLRPDPAQRPRLADIRDNLIARITEAERKAGPAKPKDSKSASPPPPPSSPRWTNSPPARPPPWTWACRHSLRLLAGPSPPRRSLPPAGKPDCNRHYRSSSTSPAPEILDHPVQRRVPPAAGLLRQHRGEPLAWMLRRGSAGSNTAADHLVLLDAAIAAVPAGFRRRLMVTADGAGASDGLVARLDELAPAAGMG